MKPITTARQTLLASILAGTTLVSTGCSSGGFPLASMNPFSKSPPPASAELNTDKGFTESLASTTSTMGQTAKAALGKTTSAVAAVFTRNKDDGDEALEGDPLSLTTGPTEVGPEVFVAQGQLWETSGNAAKAMESYVKALKSEPNHVPALTSIARLHFREGNHQQAAEFFGKAIELSPEDAGLHNDLGLTLSKLDDHIGSIRSLEKALQLAPGTSRYANNLASLKFEAGDTNRAFQVLIENNKPAVAHFNMAYLHFKNGQTTLAKQHLAEVLRIGPSAAADPAIQRAIERSRDMLAQIDGPAGAGAIAQATPQATIAGGKFLEQKQHLAAQAAALKQASQSMPTAPTPSSTLPKNASMAMPKPQTAAAAITPPSHTDATPQLPPAGTTVSPPTSTAVSAISLPPTSESPGAASPTTDRPRPIKPAASGADKPSFPFSLPSNFTGGE